MKSRNDIQFLIGLILLLGGFSLTACKDKFDELSGGAENLQFTQLMEASPYASSDYLIMSENGQYIITTEKDGETSYKHYFSIDGGQSFDLLTDKYSFLSEKTIIDTYVSNDGKFIMGTQNNKTVYELEPPGGFNNTPFVYYAFALTASGKVLSYQYDETIGQNTYFIYENGGYVSTGIPDVIDPSIGFAGASGSKVGIFANNVLAEFDVSTKSYSERPAPGGNYNNINKSQGIQAAYSEGYFAYANGAGVIIISPSDQINTSIYPAEYQFYLQTRGRVYMNKDKVYVQVSAYYGELETYVTTSTSGTEMVISEAKFPIAGNSENMISQGFIEGGNRLVGGLVLSKNGDESYLDFSFKTTVPDKAFKVGDFLYMDDKRFDIASKTFHFSGMGNITNLFYDDNQTIAYTTTGTYTSTDDKNWTLKADDQARPNLITKDAQGTFRALGIQFAPYTLGGTGFTVPQFNQNAYTSNDGIYWQLIDEKSGMTGTGPTAMTPDGSVGYTFNTTPLSNATLYRNYSFDYGITYEGFLAGTQPESYKVFSHQTANGRYVSAYFESSDGLLYINICENNKTSCKEITVTAPFDTNNSYSSAVISFTPDDRILIINGEDGIYLTSRL
jgi:hypothetical protein